MPAEEGEMQFNGTVGSDHIEGQYSNAILPNFVSYAGGYRGFRGVTQYEVGGMLYAPTSKNQNAFISLGGGYGHGTYNHFNVYMFDPSTYINSTFNSWHVQYALYSTGSKKNKGTRMGLCFKIERLHFVTYNIASQREFAGKPTIKKLVNADECNALVKTLYFSWQTPLGTQGFYCLTQCGLKITDGFVAGGSSTKFTSLYLKSQHPYISPLMLNIAFGYKFNLYYRR